MPNVYLLQNCKMFENEIKNHSLEKSELMNKVIALAEQGKLARVRFKNEKQLIFYKLI